jgi:hypothetical protein
MSPSAARVAKVKVDSDDEASTLHVVYDPQVSAEPTRRVVVSGHHYAVNPKTGIPAVFLNGETVPDWALNDSHRKKLGLPLAEKQAERASTSPNEPPSGSE